MTINVDHVYEALNCTNTYQLLADIGSGLDDPVPASYAMPSEYATPEEITKAVAELRAHARGAAQDARKYSNPEFHQRIADDLRAAARMLAKEDGMLSPRIADATIDLAQSYLPTYLGILNRWCHDWVTQLEQVADQANQQPSAA